MTTVKIYEYSAGQISEVYSLAIFGSDAAAEEFVDSVKVDTGLDDDYWEGSSREGDPRIILHDSKSSNKIYVEMSIPGESLENIATCILDDNEMDRDSCCLEYHEPNIDEQWRGAILSAVWEYTI